MKYRANHALHDGRKNIIRKGSEVSPKHPGFKHWKSKGYIDEVSDDTPMVSKLIDVNPQVTDPAGAITSETKVADIKFIKPNMVTALNDAGIEQVNDLDGWTEEMLMELPNIGEATANNLLLLLSEIGSE